MDEGIRGFYISDRHSRLKDSGGNRKASPLRNSKTSYIKLSHNQKRQFYSSQPNMPFLKPSTTISILFLILVCTQSLQVEAISISFSQYWTLISLTRSLLTRVADLRSSRGDYHGAQRAGQLASRLEGGLNLWKSMWSVGWDYMRNYAWQDMSSPSEMFATVSDVNRLLNALTELTQLKSGKEMTDWTVRNYKSVFNGFRSLSQRLLKVFYRPGPLRDLALEIQREVQGDLLRDCIEIGSNDLKGLLQIIRDLAVHFSRGSNQASAEL